MTFSGNGSFYRWGKRIFEYSGDELYEVSRLTITKGEMVWAKSPDKLLERTTGNTNYPAVHISEDLERYYFTSNTENPEYGSLVQLDSNGDLVWENKQVGIANPYAIAEDGEGSVFLGHTLVDSRCEEEDSSDSSSGQSSSSSSS